VEGAGGDWVGGEQGAAEQENGSGSVTGWVGEDKAAEKKRSLATLIFCGRHVTRRRWHAESSGWAIRLVSMAGGTARTLDASV
jgi:hypothetical protein